MKINPQELFLNFADWLKLKVNPCKVLFRIREVPLFGFYGSKNIRGKT